MNIEEFIKKIEAEFSDMEQGILQSDSIFREVMNWNSINALILIALVDTEYDVILTADDLRASSTINDLFNLVQSRIS
jgi:acyl carrier protein